jgi:hypothetical protein
MSARSALSWLLGLGPAVAVFLYCLWGYGPSRGYWFVLPFALFIGVGVLGATGVFVAYFPLTVEKLGMERLGAWLRTWWDHDAR